MSTLKERQSLERFASEHARLARFLRNASMLLKGIVVVLLTVPSVGLLYKLYEKTALEVHILKLTLTASGIPLP